MGHVSQNISFLMNKMREKRARFHPRTTQYDSNFCKKWIRKCLTAEFHLFENHCRNFPIRRFSYQLHRTSFGLMRTQNMSVSENDFSPYFSLSESESLPAKYEHALHRTLTSGPGSTALNHKRFLSSIQEHLPSFSTYEFVLMSFAIADSCENDSLRNLINSLLQNQIASKRPIFTVWKSICHLSWLLFADWL